MARYRDCIQSAVTDLSSHTSGSGFGADIVDFIMLFFRLAFRMLFTQYVLNVLRSSVFSCLKFESARNSTSSKDSDGFRQFKGSEVSSDYCFSDNAASGAGNIANSEHQQQNGPQRSSNGDNHEPLENDKGLPDSQESKDNRGDGGDRRRGNDDKPESVLACNICFELASAPVITICGHMYCWECITHWISVRTQQKCPVCRTAVTRENLIPFYGRGAASSNGPDPRRSNSSRSSRPYRMSFSPPLQGFQRRDNPLSDMHFSFYGNLFGQEIAFGEGNVQPQHFLNLVFFGIAVFVMLLMTSPFPYYGYY